MSIASILTGYKDFTTSRGLKYHYYFSAAEGGKPTILFVHGFPSLSVDWHNQITYFKAKGYGLVVPDQLGYGGTDAPEDANAYLHSFLAKDQVEILEHENVKEVFAVGHDWGAKTTSVIANLFQDRFLGFGFLSLGYLPPNTELTYEQTGELLKQALGYENFGYWGFFSAPDANETIQKHKESFWDLVHARDSRLPKYALCPTGAIRVWLESDSRTAHAPYVTKELSQIYEKEFTKNGYHGPLNFYKITVSGADMEDAKAIPLAQYPISKPVFFGGTSKDVVCPPALSGRSLTQFCPKATTHIFEAGHWVLLEKPDELNAELEKWIESSLT
ncbi:Alpha/Beta hydrolase protein [Ephemerocybe angulata]|uniref:Alpha/Beta hydrolase protein n=1 Tax=Ephemerocybe angulata TaxID=980116 RepID=A0A8H6HPX7_9AGAR|nr:Alpha/Beta hydrolase protein [Tulosesus angulatus]